MAPQQKSAPSTATAHVVFEPAEMLENSRPRTFVAWPRDPARVYFQTRDLTGVYSFWSLPTAGGSPRRLLRLAEPGRRTRRVEFDTDGRNLFFAIVDDEANVAVVSLKRP